MTDSPQQPLPPLPCPFCSAMASVLVLGHRSYRVCCDDDAVGCGAAGSLKTTEREAIEWWNRRSLSSVSPRTPSKCPVCEGLGVVTFNPALPTSTSQTSGGPWTCPTCSGKRVIWSDRKAESHSSAEQIADRTGTALIAAERERQVQREGWSSEHDDEHDGGEMAGAAASYAAIACRQVAEGIINVSGFPPGQLWRWESKWWKPSNDPLHNLVKAGALIAAEIDRLLRATPENPS